MKISRRQFVIGGASLGALALTGTSYGSSSYPSRTVKVICPYAPGGATDVFARVLSNEMSPHWGHPIVVENRTGGATAPAVNALMSSHADGHTFAIFEAVTFAINPYIFSRPPYDHTQLRPVAKLLESPLGIIVHPDFPAQNLAEFVEAVKAQPGLAFASAGTGTVLHLVMEMFRERAGLGDMVHVPYRGGNPAVQDIIAGHVPMSMVDIPTAMPYIKANQVRLLAVSSAERIEQFPDTPTIAESGYPGFQGGTWFAAFTGPDTPQELVDQMSMRLKEGLELPKVQEWLKEVAMLGTYLPPKETQAEAEELGRKYEQVIRQLNISVDS